MNDLYVAHFISPETSFPMGIFTDSFKAWDAFKSYVEGANLECIDHYHDSSRAEVAIYRDLENDTTITCIIYKLMVDRVNTFMPQI